MKSFSSSSEADVVIIGGGSVGAATLYSLSKKGVKAVLLEQNQLTSGTTWHSAGLVWRLRPSDIDIQLIAHTRQLALSLEEETGQSTGFVEAGGLFIAATQERLFEYQRLTTLGKFFGIESAILTPAETKELYPLINADDVYGSLHSHGDGTLDPTGWVNALARGAKQNHGDIRENSTVSAIHSEVVPHTVHTRGQVDRQVTAVELSTGEVIRTSAVTNCAGVWAPSVGALVGADVPLCAMRHAYVTTEPIPGIENMPNIRDHDASVYLKVQGNSIHIGGYEKNPIFWKDVLPDFSFSLFDLDWDVFAAHIVGAVQRLPVLETTGIQSTVCGPESFTADHKPLMGPVPGIRGFYLGCGFNSSGIMLAGGCGEQLAQWVVHGAPSLDMFSYDIHRFHPASMSASRRFVEEGSHEAYVKNYATVFPHDEPLGGRNIRRDPFHTQMMQAGCVFQFRHGWERPGWFHVTHTAAPGPFTPKDVSVKEYDFYGQYDNELHAKDSHGYLQAIANDNTFGWPGSHATVKREVEACRSGVAVFNQSYFGKYFLAGRDAQAAMDWICTNDMQKHVGSTVYTNMCNADGKVMCDLTVTKLAPDKFYIATGGGSATHDWEWLSHVIREKQFQCLLTDRTEEFGLLSVQGPLSQKLLQEISRTPSDFALDQFPFSTSKYVVIAGHEVLAIRLTFVGEMGFELHIPVSACQDVYAALFSASYLPVNAGYRAIDSMSIEKGFKHWHEDLRMDDSPLEAGLGFICKLKGDVDFVGKAALLRQRKDGLRRRLACFLIEKSGDASDAVDEELYGFRQAPLHGGEVIYLGDDCVGYLRRAGFGHSRSIKRSIGYGYVEKPCGGVVDPSFLKNNTFHIEGLGETRMEAFYQPKCVFDPTHQRVKGIYE
eukprot:CAMPEP_0114428998 /NCGR_PEP_ID=MMETSP0103-20121206/9239_1 /TAXON_ID=37642 ORGANISM="Paraphysomonas imperforata, Strain PA2" /NCGR_SAMPLE_ID=MMETSP0103 /ASSEMBLY_ACC=CAM_ASM_000201 /LENGTH=887 /DNA_ID=CAMNT_0001598281 /DNA_START=162 /DNA_END=2825 /DNA_ORIENTATION=-